MGKVIKLLPNFPKENKTSHATVEWRDSNQVVASDLRRSRSYSIDAPFKNHNDLLAQRKEVS